MLNWKVMDYQTIDRIDLNVNQWFSGRKGLEEKFKTSNGLWPTIDWEGLERAYRKSIEATCWWATKYVFVFWAWKEYEAVAVLVSGRMSAVWGQDGPTGICNKGMGVSTKSLNSGSERATQLMKLLKIFVGAAQWCSRVTDPGQPMLRIRGPQMKNFWMAGWSGVGRSIRNSFGSMPTVNNLANAGWQS